MSLLLFALLSFAARSSPASEPASDPCAIWLLDTFGGGNSSSDGGWCDALSRDTVMSVVGAPAPIGAYSSYSPCSCGAGAIFILNLFSSFAAAKLAYAGLPFSNMSAALFQWANFINSNDHRTWSSTTCVPPSAAMHAATFQQLRCSLGLSPCVMEEAMPRLVQVWLDSRLLEDDHTFVLQRAGPDEFYLWQSYVDEYDLWTWVQQVPNPDRNWTGTSAYAGRLGAGNVSQFLSTLESLTSGAAPWRDIAPLWQELFWVSPPMPETQNTTCGTTSADPIRLGVGWWTQDYFPPSCAANEALFNVTWDAAHAVQRDNMCQGSAGHVIASCKRTQTEKAPVVWDHRDRFQI
jgi:hypothetical protein